MTNIYRKLFERFRSQWMGIKFYKDKPDLNGAKRLKNVRFCEATKEAIIYPIILDRDNISSLGSQHVFGWRSDYKHGLFR